MKHLLLTVFVAFCYLFCNAENGFVALKSYVTKDSVMLRWSPSSFAVWQVANKYGYKVDRMLLSNNGKVVSNNNLKMLHDGVIKPLAEAEWLPTIKQDSTYAAIALQALWGETFELTSTFKTSMMQAYNKVRENESRFGFAMYCADRSRPVAKALGVFLVDRHVRINEKYIYRVYINAPISEAVDTAYVVVDPSAPSDLVIPLKPIGAQMGNSILLSWESVGTDYVGYHVERSTDGKSFQRLTKDLVIPFSNRGKMVGFKTDSLNSMKGQYTYRIMGITPFGIAGPYSDTILVNAAKVILSPTNLDVAVTSQNQILLRWTFDGEKKGLAYFDILRSTSAAGEYKVVGIKVDAKEKQWLDTNPLSNGYYKVVAVSKLGAKGESLEVFAQLTDNTPPLPPVGATGGIDTAGVVTLKWNANIEADLMGYKVFRANSLNGEYVQISKSIISSNYFSDTIVLQTLTKNVFYKFAAVDKRYNSSEFSAVCVLKRPDIVAPAPPVLTAVSNMGTHTSLNWKSSPSCDVESVHIYRCLVGQGDFTLIQTVGRAITEYADTALLQNGATYVYRLCAVDSSENRSTYSNEYSISYKASKVKSKPIALKGCIIEQGGKPAVSLTWNSTLKGNIRLYRKANNGSMLLYKMICNEGLYTDIGVQEGVLYEYLIVFNSELNSETYKVKL
jgi:hypothetical protein